MRIYSHKDRPVHMGPYPLELLARLTAKADLSDVPDMPPLTFHNEVKENLINAMGPYAAMLDLIQDGMVKKQKGEIPNGLLEKANHLKAFAYYHDASQAGVCELTPECILGAPILNHDISNLEQNFFKKQSKTFAAGIDLVLDELMTTVKAPSKDITGHTHAIAYLYEYPRDPKKDEVGADWIQNAQAHRASIRAAETGVVLANYIRLLGYEAKSHTLSQTGVDIGKVIISAGLGEVIHNEDAHVIEVPYLGTRYGVGVVTTTFPMARDHILKTKNDVSFPEKFKGHGPKWWFGKGFAKNKFNALPYKSRRFKDGLYPFERLKRVDKPTTYIDEDRIPRVPKRADMFARAIFGDMGEKIQNGAKNGNYVRKSPTSFGARRPLAAFVLLQDGAIADTISSSATDSQRNADNITASLYFLGADAVGISRCPDWVYYSHNSHGEKIIPYHENAISVVVDQGHETMEGASGDDWIACSQSMRAYLRFSLFGGIIAEQVRRLGYSARCHSVMDGEVLQPPLLLLSGLGEVSRIGEVILNPFLGPRLKSGVITTNMPLAHNKPIDFGLQNFCNNCNKCARECPSGAITAGPKTMFNGYEIWKSDSQKCTSYRITQKQGAMCGRCMKTCPWNLEGLFVEAPFRWMASNVPVLAKSLAQLDDKLGNGQINPVKKWWWDLEMVDDGPYSLTQNGVNERDLEVDLDLKYEDQTLAVYPAHLAPPPYPYPYPMDREAGIQAYKDMLSPEDYIKKRKNNQLPELETTDKYDSETAPVFKAKISNVIEETKDTFIYELKRANGKSLPAMKAGAHIDIVVAPEFLRQYSLAGDPSDTSKYVIAVLREADGRGGSELLHKIFKPGREVFISRPINHFPLDEKLSKAFLMGGGIGITPMLAMAHELHAEGRDFELHYSVKSRDRATFLETIQSAPWHEKAFLHISSEGSRVDLNQIFRIGTTGWHVYTCGADKFMDAVFDACLEQGWPEGNLHREYFSAPETPEYENHDFTLKLAKTGINIPVSKDETATEALAKHGVNISVKCSDGICGVCKCGIIKGDVEHRDFVLSKSQREDNIILCQSRAEHKDGIIEIDL